MKYYNINSGEISSRPTSKTTSNLWLNAERLSEEGWLPIELNIPSIDSWQSYGGWQTDVQADKVVRTRLVVDKSLAQFKREKISELCTNARELRIQSSDGFEELLFSVGIGTAPQAGVNLVTNRLSDIHTAMWSAVNQIRNASTLQEVDAVNISLVT